MGAVQIDKFDNPAPPLLRPDEIVKVVLVSGAILALFIAALFGLAMLNVGGGADLRCILDGCEG